MKSGDSTTPIAAPLEVDGAAAVEWSDEAEVVVVGWGAAGACAAIEARAGRQRAGDRPLQGGGASALSGGVVYAGGGTPYQQQAGFADTPRRCSTTCGSR
jgi:3-oxo-5alpha-steroid 4-dehydrogenase